MNWRSPPLMKMLFAEEYQKYCCLETLASGCSLSLLSVCSIWAAKTMRKGRTHPRNPARNQVVLQKLAEKPTGQGYPFSCWA